MQEVSTIVQKKGENIFADGRVAKVGHDFDWTKFTVSGDHSVYSVLLHDREGQYDRCTCPWGAYNPGESRVCSHIYAAHLHKLQHGVSAVLV